MEKQLQQTITRKLVYGIMCQVQRLLPEYQEKNKATLLFLLSCKGTANYRGLEYMYIQTYIYAGLSL